MRWSVSAAVGVAFCLALTALADPPADPCRATLAVQPWRAHVVDAQVPPTTAASLVTATKMFPGFRPECLIAVDGEAVARVPLTSDGRLRFYIAAGVVRERTNLTLELRPSATRTPEGTPLAWALTILHSEPTPHMPQTCTIDIGHPADLPFVGRGFSYQEGAQARGQPWADDQDFRWSRPGCRLRLPVVPGNGHTVALLGEVPVGFRVLSGDRELARFARPQPGQPYVLDVSPTVTATARWLDLTLVNLDPMPLPNLDLRELFWALEKVEVTTVGPGGVFEPSALPAVDLADAAFRAALSADDRAAPPIPLRLKARWDLPAGYKTPVQLQQEVATVLAHGGAWVPGDDADPEDATYVFEHLLAPVRQTAGPLQREGLGRRMTGDVGVLVTRVQRAAARLRPSTSDPLLEPARGAFRMLQALQRTAVILDETTLALRGRDLACVILSNPTFCDAQMWAELERHVDAGGKLIVVAGLGLPAGDDPAAARVRALLGSHPTAYMRGQHRVPLDDEYVQLFNDNWQAVLALDGARELLPLQHLSAAGDQPPWPAVALHVRGAGTAATLACDPFEHYNRYSSPAYARLLDHTLDALDVRRSLEIQGAPQVVPATAVTADGFVVQLTNAGRGHFDGAGLMNAACPAVFADALPETPPVTVQYACAAQPTDVRIAPPEPPASWSWRDGRLRVELPTVDVQRTIAASVDASQTPDAPRRGQAALPADRPLVRLGEWLRDRAGLIPPLRTAWPVEEFEGQPFLWLGTGPAEGVTFMLVGSQLAALRLNLDVVAGHGRTDALRNLVLTRNGAPVWTGRFETVAALAVPLTLGAGEHTLCLYCTDEATITRHPNGDTRNLLVGLRGLRIEAAP